MGDQFCRKSNYLINWAERHRKRENDDIATTTTTSTTTTTISIHFLCDCVIWFLLNQDVFRLYSTFGN